MNLRAKRKMAAGILKCGVNRVWIDPARAADIKTAITKADIRKLIAQGAIGARPKQGVSRARARFIQKQKKAGRRRGVGKRQGAGGARAPKKRLWIARIRALRQEMRLLKNEKKISPRQYRQLYRLADSGVLRSRAHLRLQVKKTKEK